MMMQRKLAAQAQGRAMAKMAPAVSQAVPSGRAVTPMFTAPVTKASVPRVERALRQLVAPAAAFGANGASTSTFVEKSSTPLDIVFVSTEVAPWSKTGGLGDVVGGLPIELAKRGHRVITVAPRYDQYADGWDTSVCINIDGEQVRFFHAFKKGVHRVFVDHPTFLAKVWGKTGSKLYGPKSGADFVDNHKRFALFCKAAIESVKVLPFGPGENCVFVANDWHSSLVPVLIKDVYQPRGQFKNAKTALCIHNVAFQGRMWEDAYKEMGLPASSLEKFTFTDGYDKIYNEKMPMSEDEKTAPTGKTYKKINWLKAGILASDKLLTVSPNYASEISSSTEKGMEMEKFIRIKGGIEGIVNGMDIEEWDPRKDKYLTVKYDKSTVFQGKAAAKEALQAELGLPVDPRAPMFAFVGRLEEQKGVDIMLAAIPKIVAANPTAQIAILGTGKAKMEKEVQALDKKYKGQVKGVVKFSAPLAHMLTAGADFFLVPSRFEPCGLIQLHAMQYGTIPLVSSTGGLVDTVKEGQTGFHMGAFNQDALATPDVDAIAATATRACEVFKTPLFKEMVTNAINQDLSWSKPAKKWEGILEELYLNKPSARPAAQSVPTPVQAPLTRTPVQAPQTFTQAPQAPLASRTPVPAPQAPVASPVTKAPVSAVPQAPVSAPVATKVPLAPVSTRA